VRVVDELIEELIRTGRDVTNAELRELRRLVADAGFGPNAISPAGGDVAGLVWQGMNIASGDWLPNETLHFLKHVVAGQEWPTGTSLDEYVQSLRDTILEEEGAVSMEQVHTFHRLTFLSSSNRWRGPNGGPWILVGYNINYAYWSTGFQPKQRQISFIQEERSNRRWLQRLS
jgi:hypothetical protein